MMLCKVEHARLYCTKTARKDNTTVRYYECPRCGARYTTVERFSGKVRR